MFFINPNRKKCGVYSLGLSAYEAIRPLGFVYTEDIYSLPKDSLYIFNWHPGTGLGALNKEWLNNLGGKTIGFLHDPYNNPDFFNIKARLDPDFVDSHPFYSLPRIIKDYKFPEVKRDKVIISSWGFGLFHKSFTYLMNLIEKQMSNTTIRLHIPFSDWCDSDGKNAVFISDRCKEIIKNNTIEITHEYMKEDDFVAWANKSDINLFACDPINAGISSCIDTALACQKPIGVNKCPLYKHIWNETTSLENNTINQLLTNNQNLNLYREKWTEDKFREKIQFLIEKL